MTIMREAYCNQEMTDNAIDFLQSARPELAKRLLEGLRALPETFPETLEQIRAFLDAEAAKGAILIPATYLGMIDLLFELSRRFEAAYGWPWPVYRPKDGRSPFTGAEAEKVVEAPHFTVRGKPLTDNLQPPLPPLPSLAVSERNQKKGLRQDLADHVLSKLYELHPQLWIELSEEMRRQLLFVRTERLLLPRLEALLKDDRRFQTTADRYLFITEIRRRISSMCELPFYK